MPFPPRPSDGPRCRSTPVASIIPRTDARASTTWRLQPSSASLVLWRKPRNPPSVAACTLNPGVDATAAARPELLHGSSPSTLHARVPAIQKPSARSHRTVDNSLITGRIEYHYYRLSHRKRPITAGLFQTGGDSLLPPVSNGPGGDVNISPPGRITNRR